MTDKRTKAIRVCFVAPKSYPLFNPDIEEVFGGAEVDLYYLATELAKDPAFDVMVIVADYGQPARETAGAVTLIRSLDFKKSSLAGALKLWSALSRAHADIYLIKTMSPGVPLLAAFCSTHRKVFLYRTSSAPQFDRDCREQHPRVGKAFDWALRRAKFVFAQSEEVKADLEQHVGVRRVMVIPNGHPLGPLNQYPRETILWVGRSDPVKRPDLFIDLAQRTPDQPFVMVCQRATGDRRYASLVARAGRVRNLQFIERVPFGKIDECFQRARVFVNTSDSEGFPNTFIQAAQWAVPILSLNTNPDGFLERHQCGICCEGSTERMAEALRSLLADNRFVEIGRNARRYVEQKHDLSRIVEQYKRIFRDLI
jgi:glycosyltransferase involved in cell wall biosynthesis